VFSGGLHKLFYETEVDESQVCWIELHWKITSHAKKTMHNREKFTFIFA